MIFSEFDNAIRALTETDDRLRLRDLDSPFPRGFSVFKMTGYYRIVTADGVAVLFDDWEESVSGTVSLYYRDCKIGAIIIEDMEVRV